jgi:protein-arginine kinase activator protein McsA
MTVCDICKTKKANYDVTVTVDDDGRTESMELCGLCYREFRYRQDRAKHKAYEETVKAVNGEIKRKSHWWDMFCW